MLLATLPHALKAGSLDASRQVLPIVLLAWYHGKRRTLTRIQRKLGHSYNSTIKGSTHEHCRASSISTITSF